MSTFVILFKTFPYVTSRVFPTPPPATAPRCSIRKLTHEQEENERQDPHGADGFAGRAKVLRELRRKRDRTRSVRSVGRSVGGRSHSQATGFDCGHDNATRAALALTRRRNVGMHRRSSATRSTSLWSGQRGQYRGGGNDTGAGRPFTAFRLPARPVRSATLVRRCAEHSNVPNAVRTLFARPVVRTRTSGLGRRRFRSHVRL
jgi:hypothetical protein